MLLSNSFTKAIGIELSRRLAGLYFVLNSSNRRNEVFVLTIYIVTVLMILSASRIVQGDDHVCIEPLPTSINETAEHSEIYEISTRHLSDRFRSINFNQPNVEVNKWLGNHWSRSTVEDALPIGGSGMLTVIYVHGNFMERNNALERVRIVNGYFKSYSDRPYRLLMLSWPSQREKKPLRDVLSNAESAECQSLYVAWMLQRLRNEAQVSLLGFSFGARAVTGGLHLDAGGVLPGYVTSPMQTLDASTLNASLKYRVGLVAPALDRNWIELNGRHQMAMSHVESLVNLYNSKDPILRRFRFIDRLSRPIAAGFAGFAGLASFADPRATVPLTGQSRIRQFDCGSGIGTTHSEKSYYGQCPYYRTLIEHLLWKVPAESNCNASVFP